MLDRDANSAKTFTFFAIMLQLLFFLIDLVVVAPSLSLFTMPAGTTAKPPPGLGSFSILFASFFFFGFVWVLLDYLLIYKNLEDERIKEAKTPALILGILQIPLGGIIVGILLLAAYTRIKYSIAGSSQSGVAMQQNQHNPWQ
ncbi:MAG: hypothetical protein PXX82_06445 [Methanomassiliicoccales archaeon]|nr:hypothetical protein [Methanomassiliicoccales archaeon]